MLQQTSCNQCKPAVTVSTNLFDHKSVLLSLGGAAPLNVAKIPRLRNCNMDNPHLKYSVLHAAYRCYSFGIKTEFGTDLWAQRSNLVNNIKNKTKIISEKLLEVSTMLKNVAMGGETQRDVMEIAAIYSEIDLTFLDLPSLDHLAELASSQKSVTLRYFLRPWPRQQKKLA